MNTESRNEVVPVQQSLPAEALANIDSYLEATSAESAKFLKFAKGEYLAGVDEEEIEAGTEVVVNVAGITCGHIKWEDGIWYGTLVYYSQEFPGPNVDVELPKDSPRDKSTTGPRVLSSLEFAAEFSPPDYIVDQLVQQGYVNSLTGRTGDGKTALCLYIAFCVARGVPFCDHETERGAVLYLAGENADDVRVRAIVMADRTGTTLDKLDILWITAP